MSSYHDIMIRSQSQDHILRSARMRWHCLRGQVERTLILTIRSSSCRWMDKQTSITKPKPHSSTIPWLCQISKNYHHHILNPSRCWISSDANSPKQQITSSSCVRCEDQNGRQKWRRNLSFYHQQLWLLSILNNNISILPKKSWTNESEMSICEAEMWLMRYLEIRLGLILRKVSHCWRPRESTGNE